MMRVSKALNCSPHKILRKHPAKTVVHGTIKAEGHVATIVMSATAMIGVIGVAETGIANRIRTPMFWLLAMMCQPL
jgi:hypothetical protein